MDKREVALPQKRIRLRMEEGFEDTSTNSRRSALGIIKLTKEGRERGGSALFIDHNSVLQNY